MVSDNTTQRNATQRNATQRNATQRNATQRNATQRNATQRNATQRNATQRNATQRNAIQTKLPLALPNLPPYLQRAWFIEVLRYLEDMLQKRMSRLRYILLVTLLVSTQLLICVQS